jgi:hypothetical protein
MNIIDAIHDPNLFRPLFKDLATWSNWLVLLKGIFALPMERAERRVFKKLTGGRQSPIKEAKEIYLIIGRRGGKSFMISVIAVYLSVFHSYQQYLAVGEKVVIMVLARDKIQARIILRYIKGILNSVPMFSQMVVAEKVESIELNNDVNIEIHVSDYRAVRGRSIAAVILEEAAFWPMGESASPDTETLVALRPATLTIPTSKIFAISSPYAKKGILYDAYKNHFSKNGDTLVWQAPSIVMNPTLNKREIERAFELDPESAKAEFNAEFRSDISNFIDREIVEQATIPGRYELLPLPQVRYVGFCDPAGGSGKDSMTLGISHCENDLRILDCLREARPPFSPSQICKEFSDLLKKYHIYSVKGDRFSGGFVKEGFMKHGISYEVSEKVKSEIYLEFLSLINSGQCQLLDNKRMINQLLTLERRVQRSGRDGIDHGLNASDDLANAMAGSIIELKGYLGKIEYFSVVKREFYERHEHEAPGGGDTTLRMRAADQYSQNKISRNKFGKGAY